MAALSEDLDGNLTIEDSKTGEISFNVDKIAFHLFCEAHDIPTYITTLRGPHESLGIVFKSDYKKRTIQYCLDQFKLYGLKRPQIVTFYDPLEKSYFKKVMKLESHIVSLIPTILEEIAEEVKKAKETNEMELSNDLLIRNAILKNKTYLNLKQEQEPEIKRLEELDKDFKEKNKSKLLQLKSILKFGNAFCHVDDSYQGIIEEIEKWKQEKSVDGEKIENQKEGIENKTQTQENQNGADQHAQSKEMEAQEEIIKNNILPIWYRKNDSTHEWQLKVAEHIGLEGVATRLFKSENYNEEKLEDIEKNVRGQLAILLYLHQNKVAFKFDEKKMTRLDAITKKFMEKVNVQTLNLTPELKKYSEQVLKMNFPKALFRSVSEFFIRPKPVKLLVQKSASASDLPDEKKQNDHVAKSSSASDISNSRKVSNKESTTICNEDVKIFDDWGEGLQNNENTKDGLSK